MTSLYVRVSQPRFCWHSELADSCCEGCPACTFSMFSSIPACYPLDTSSIPLPPCVITKNITEWGQMSPGWGWGDKVPPGWEPLLFTSDQRFQISVQRPTTFSSVSSWAFFFHCLRQLHHVFSSCKPTTSPPPTMESHFYHWNTNPPASKWSLSSIQYRGGRGPFICALDSFPLPCFTCLKIFFFLWSSN